MVPREESVVAMVERRGDGWGERVTTALSDGLSLIGAALYVAAEIGEPWCLACAHGAIEAPPRVHWQLPDACGELALPLLVGEPAPQTWQACIPIRSNGSPVGLLAVGAKRSGGELGAADNILIDMVAAQLAAAWPGSSDAVQEPSRGPSPGAYALRPALRPVVAHRSGFQDIIGTSPALLRVLDLVERVATTDASVLITGETGTGKELIARAVHEHSARRTGPFVALNCPAIPLDLAESELFGHERGAFTGANEVRPGKLESADHGTIFLDEVGELPLIVQVKLLRVLQEREVQRVGSNKSRKVDVRIVAATNRDLRAESATGSFREDLFYRLAAVPVHLPPLRERQGDIALLATHILGEACGKYGRNIRGFAPEALGALESHVWPGNIRELQHVVQRAVLMCDGERLEKAQLGDFAVDSQRNVSLHTTLKREKLRRIEAAMIKTRGNQSAAARLLGMSRSNFARLLKALDLRPARERYW